MGWTKRWIVVVCIFLGPLAWGGTRVVGGGVLLAGEHSEVVELLLGSNERCTATFITDEHVLTAAHCTTHFVPAHLPSPFQVRQNLGTEGMRLFQVETVKAANGAFSGCPHLRWPYIDRKSAEKCLDPSQDVAILRIQGTSSVWARLATERANIGDLVSMIGFGRNHLGDEWIKRIGWNRIQSHPENLGYVVGGPGCPIPGADPIESVTSSGDSGGPLFNALGEVIGVTSTLKVNNPSIPFEDYERLESSFADILNPSVYTFIDEALHSSFLERPPIAAWR